MPDTNVPESTLVSAQDLVEALRQQEPLGDRFSRCTIDGPVDGSALDYPHKLVIRDSFFRGPVDLRDARFGRTVDLGGCTFEQGVCFAGTRVGGELVLDDAVIRERPAGTVPLGRSNSWDCTIPRGADEPWANFHQVQVERNVIARRLQVEGWFVLGGARIAGQVDFREARVEGDLDLEQAVIGEALFCNCLGLHRTEVRGQLILDGATVKGLVRLSGVRILRGLNLQSTHVGEDVMCNTLEDKVRPEIHGGAWLAGVKAVRIDFRGARITGDLDLQYAELGESLFCKPDEGFRTEIDGNVSLEGARVAGEVNCDSALITGNLNLQGATVGGNVSCTQQPTGQGGYVALGVPVERAGEQPRAEIGGRVWLVGARVAGRVDLRGAAVGGALPAAAEPPNVLDLQNAAIGEDVLCSPAPGGPRTEIAGTALLTGAKVMRQVDFSGARIAGDLDLGDAHIDGDLRCRAQRERTEVGRDAWLGGTRVAGDVDLWGVRIAGELALYNAHVGGDLLCKPGGAFRTEVGSANLVSVHVGGRVQFDGAVVGGDLDLRDSHVGNTVSCSTAGDTGPGTEVGGRLVLTGARVEGGVDLCGARVGTDVDLRKAEVRGELLCLPRGGQATRVGKDFDVRAARLTAAQLDGRCCPDGTVNLALAQVVRLEIVDRLPARLDAQGLQFQELNLPGSDYQGFLERSAPFQKSNYQFMEGWLRNRGHDDQARNVYLAMRRRDRRSPARA